MMRLLKWLYNKLMENESIGENTQDVVVSTDSQSVDEPSLDLDPGIPYSACVGTGLNPVTHAVCEVCHGTPQA